MAFLADLIADATPTGSDGSVVDATGSDSLGGPVYGLQVRPIGGPFAVDVVSIVAGTANTNRTAVWDTDTQFNYDSPTFTDVEKCCKL